MSIHFISGKPGGGKSLYAVRLLVNELVHGKRHIVTNLALRMDRLNEYIQSDYPQFYDSMGHIADRITILQEEELGVFFTFRGHGIRLHPNHGAKNLYEFKEIIDDGCVYFLDELHIAFNSRAWASTGKEVLYYLSQHRKLGDDVICITQSVTNVDKQFRTVAQDFTYLRNLKKEKLGLFGLPGIFMRRTYLSPANDTSKPMESGTFTLDVSGLASCYDTAKGVGIHGQAADTGEKRKGLHWGVAVVGLPLLAFGLYMSVPKLLARFFMPVIPEAHAHATNRPSSSNASVTSQQASLAANTISQAKPISHEIAGWVVGFVKIGGEGKWYLSNSAVIPQSSGRIQKSDEGLLVDGKLFLWEKPTKF